MALPITYKYEVYRNGTFLGILPNVSSAFTYTQDINTGGSQIVITSALDIDTQNQPVVLMTDESGNQMTDESGTYTMTTDRVTDIYGGNIFQSMFQNGNEIKVWEYTQFQPNGVLVFDGRVTRWNPHIGNNDSVDLTVLSFGVELDNNILYGSLSVDQSVTSPSPDTDITVAPTGPTVAQTFTTGPDVTNIQGVSFMGGGLPQTGTSNPSIEVQAFLYTYAGGTPNSGSLLGSSTAQILPQSNIDNPATVPLLTMDFTSVIPVLPNSTYAIVFDTIAVTNSNFFVIGSANTYENGSAFYDNFGTWTQEDFSIVFLTYAANSQGELTNSVYFNEDPAAMVTDFITNYVSGGGHITIGNVESSSAIATYPFVLNTVLEGLTAALTMAPSGYYWYVDVGTSLLYFQAKNTTPDHTFTFKVHINTFELLAITETTINAAYLTAGNDTNGNSILVYAENIESIANFGQVLDRITDGRILDYVTAQLVINNYVQTNCVENYQSTINIMASNYDLTTLKLGQIIGFNGFNSYADNLQMQVVSIARYEDYAQLTLGVVPKRASSKAEKIERSLLATQTINNPLSAI